MREKLERSISEQVLVVTSEPGKGSKTTEERILSHSHNDSIYDTLDNSYPSLGLRFLNGIRDYIAAPMFYDRS